MIDNMRARQLDVEAPDKLWLTVITDIRTPRSYAYLAVVLGLNSRDVVDRMMQSRQTADVVLRWARRRNAGGRVLIHSNQSSPFTAMGSSNFVWARQLEHSMNLLGNCHTAVCRELLVSLLVHTARNASVGIAHVQP